ncbi:universal stress protein A-like protein [Prunus persica]|uniref:universal stress protein A-like protein n=1 Tax=Prunus persica TaxID=3760 RepID=UPI0009AB5ED2|nr:universal stress protein A-like protein [Prunus persica]
MTILVLLLQALGDMIMNNLHFPSRFLNITYSMQVTDVTVELVEGDARNVLCDAVDRHHASVLVVGSHGYGAIKRAVLGSVSDYCAHHAHCSVMIVKKPKTKH